MIARTALASLALLSTGCATALVERAPPPEAPLIDAYAGAIDWAKARDELAAVLSGYLQVDTFNPPGNEARGAEYLAKVLEQAGIRSKISEIAPGRGLLVARLEARRDSSTPRPAPESARDAAADGPLCLLSHLDVVPAVAAEWPKDRGPLSGVLADGYVWGRGALDMKGMGALEVMTLVWLARLHVPLRRDVVLVAVPDEEVANTGMRELVEHRWEEVGCTELVNEGGLGVRGLLFEDQTVFPISVAEKGVAWIRMTAHGKPGHGSTPRAETAPARLVRALERLGARDAEVTIHPAIYELLANVGEQHGGFSGFVLKRPWWVRRLAMGDLLANPVTRATITNTVNVTHFSTPPGEPNVVPSEASAIIDSRLLPGVPADVVLGELKRLVGDDLEVTFEVIRTFAGNESPTDDPFYLALGRHAVRGRSDAVFGPAVSPGFTDSILARPRGVRAYGLVPFEVGKEDLETMHGNGERVSVENLGNGLRILLGAVLDVAAEPAR